MKTIHFITSGFFSLIFLFSCEDFIEVDDPKGQIAQENVFENEATTTAAVSSLYAKLRDDSFVTGKQAGMGILMGLYADELDYYGSTTQPINTIYHHQLIASTTSINTIWTSAYQLIYMANACLDGIENSKNLSETFKDQTKAEVLFIRALVYFYLTNLYGDIPYTTTIDYTINQHLSRRKIEFVYQQIQKDLDKAEVLLQNKPFNRIKVNQFAVNALKSRIGLYAEDWKTAEENSTKIINQSVLFKLEPNLANEFLKDSQSAIFQLKPLKEGDITHEASAFHFVSGPPPFVALSPKFIQSFEPTDLRLQFWIKTIKKESQSWHSSSKYKQTNTVTSSSEYSIIFRLAEIYFIRAEARLKQGNLTGALEDLNRIRNRAGLNSIASLNQDDIFQAIVNERKHELFTEQGHCWFDLKRWKIAENVLKPIKVNWKSTDILFPIPENEIMLNPNLQPQNSGY
jgi:starch-binding outer membrane protein, SusD/RagB family